MHSLLTITKLLGYESLQFIRSVSERGVRVLALEPSMAAQVFLMSAPKQLGGRGDFSLELKEESKRVNVSRESLLEFAQQVI